MVCRVGKRRLVTLSQGGYRFANAEAAALVARMTTQPSGARKALIDALIGAMKTAGVWSKMDALYVLAAHDPQAARLNWVSSQSLTALNSPAFTVDKGYQSDGSTSYLTGPFSPSQMTLNSTFIYIGIQASSPLSDGLLFSAGTSRFQLSGTTDMKARVNDASGAKFSATGAGRYQANRSSSSARQFYKNGSQSTTDTVASTSTTTGTFSLLSFFGVAFAGDRLSSCAFGSSLNSTEVAAFDSALAAYLTAVGA